MEIKRDILTQLVQERGEEPGQHCGVLFKELRLAAMSETLIPWLGTAVEP